MAVAAAAVSASCRTLSNADAKGPAGPLFVLVHWHEVSRQFDIWLTDCNHAWSATGCSVAYQAMDADAAWERTKEALGDEAAAPTQYAHSARTPTRGPEQQLELTWSWQRNNSQVREMMRAMPLLQQQQDSSAAIRLVMTHIMASYTAMKAAMDESRKAQLLLERSLRDRQQQLQQKTQEWQGKEQALFTKFAMLLNTKTERIQALNDTVQEQAQQLEQLHGEEEHNTDDEALAGVYGAETEDDESDEPAQLQQHDNPQQQQLQLLKQEEHPTQDQPLPAPGAAAGTAIKPDPHEAAAAAAAAPVDAMDLDQATQLLDDEAQAALELQRQRCLQKQQQQQQQQQQLNGKPPGAAVDAAAQQAVEGGGAATGLVAPAAAAGASSGGALGQQQQQQQQQQGGPADDTQHKPKAFKRRR